MSTQQKTQTTSEYSLFIHNQYQQPMAERHVREIAESMKRLGFLRSKPVTVVRDGNKLRLVDGHHRLAAAKAINVPVVYVIEEEGVADAIGELNFTVRKWASMSFIKMYADQGNPHYIELLRYVEQGLPAKNATSLLRGESAGSCNASRAIRTGTFKIKSRRSADVILKYITDLGKIAPVVKSAHFIEAVSLLLFVPEFDPATLTARIDANPRALVKCASGDQMLDLIEDIYNFRAREKLALAFMARRAAKERQLAFSSATKAA